jgi:Predicted integral membrane protein (DUF2269)
MSWFHLFLFLHIVAAIVAFGPTFAFPLIAGLAKKQPMHMPFALRAIEVLEERLVVPFVLTMPISGLLMAFNISIEWRHNLWLIAAICVYVVAVTFSITVQGQTVKKMLAMISAGAHGGAPAMAPMPAGPGSASAGPPPAFLALARRMQLGGMALSVAFFVIVVLMIWKPGGNI